MGNAGYLKSLLYGCCLSLLFTFFFTPKLNAQDTTLISQIKTASGKEKIELLNKYAASFVRHNTKERLRLSEEALAEARKINYSKGIADGINNCGLCYYYMRDYKKALSYFAQSLPMFVAAKDSNAIGGSYNNIANIYIKLKMNDSAVVYHNLALKVRMNLGAMMPVSTTLTSLGLLYLAEGKYERALDYFQKALEIREKLGAKLSIASTLNNIGVLYWKWGNLSGALECYERSLKLSTEVNFINSKVLAELNIGLINIYLGEYEFARNIIHGALQESDSTGLDNGMANGYYYLAILSNKTGNWDASLNLINKSTPYFEKAEDNNALSKLNNLAAQNYIMKNELGNAGNSVNLALKDAKIAGDESLAAQAYLVMGKMELLKKNYNKSLRYTTESLDINNTKRQLEQIVEGEKQMADIYTRMGNYKTAAEYFKTYAAAKDSLYSQKLAANITNWRVKYESADQENKILKLNRENSLHVAEILKQKNLRNFFIIISLFVITILGVMYYFYRRIKKMNEVIGRNNRQLDELNRKLEVQNQQLTNSNRTKDKLFSIISHDLKGPFSGLLGLSAVLGEEAGSMSHDELTDSAKLINRSAGTLFRLTKNLLDWSRIQTDSIKASPENLNVKKVFDGLAETLKTPIEEKKITLKTSAVENISVYSDPQILDTIFRNLVTNAIKFTNKGGEIKLSAEDLAEGIKFRISDNGVGISPENLKKIFIEHEFHTSNGTEGEHGSGLGIKICRDLTALSGGKLQAQSELGIGTEFSFVLPKGRI